MARDSLSPQFTIQAKSSENTIEQFVALTCHKRVEYKYSESSSQIENTKNTNTNKRTRTKTQSNNNNNNNNMKILSPNLFAIITCIARLSFSSAIPSHNVTKDDLDELYKELSTFAVPKHVDSDAWLRECAFYIMNVDYAGKNPGEPKVDDGWVLTDYFYKDAKHGHCTMKLESAFGMMNWNYTLKAVFDDYFNGIEPGSKEHMELKFSEIEQSLPSMSLPSFMIEPRTAKDAVEAVNFAKVHGLQLSVKNTGHDYAGQSDVKDSLQLNMRDFPKYSENEIVVCKEGSETSPLEGPPCVLALARGKTAIVRVSGSEGNDSIYKNVHNWNHQMPREKRFQISGGGEGAVGAGGGYLMGGGLGMGSNDRKWGIAIDQVLELEMVLANGQHVKFGPSEWDVVEGFLYPQTKRVKGLCNKNIHHLETQWEWGECEEDIAFDDLWFAVRGGGGGTWGVLISSWQQLHDDDEWFLISSNVDASNALTDKCKKEGNCETIQKMANKIWVNFVIDFMNGPISEGFGNEMSSDCGYNSAEKVFGEKMPLVDDGLVELTCIGKDAANQMIASWQIYVRKSEYLLDSFNDTELLQDIIHMAPMAGNYGDFTSKSSSIGESVGPGVFLANHTLSLEDGADTPMQPSSWMKTPLGHARSSKTAGVYSPYKYNLLIPTAMILEKSDLVLELLRVCGGHEWGRNTAISSDGMDSMPKLFRQSLKGCQLDLDSSNMSTYGELDKYFSEVQSKIMEYVNEDDIQARTFPGFQEKNHLQGNTPLPLKDDWTKVCPYNLSDEERKKKCMSAQESVWGTENMERMEKIKMEIDPSNMFQVYHGIGQRDVSPRQEYKWPTQFPKNYDAITTTTIANITTTKTINGSSSRSNNNNSNQSGSKRSLLRGSLSN